MSKSIWHVPKLYIYLEITDSSTGIKHGKLMLVESLLYNEHFISLILDYLCKNRLKLAYLYSYLYENYSIISEVDYVNPNFKGHFLYDSNVDLCDYLYLSEDSVKLYHGSTLCYDISTELDSVSRLSKYLYKIGQSY